MTGREPNARAGRSATSTFLVRLKKTSGSAGDATTTCSWVYSAYSALETVARITAGTATAIATGLTPKRPRIPLCAYDYAANGSFGLAGYDPSDSSFMLLDAYGEAPAETGACDGA